MHTRHIMPIVPIVPTKPIAPTKPIVPKPISYSCT